METSVAQLYKELREAIHSGDSFRAGRVRKRMNSSFGKLGRPGNLPCYSLADLRAMNAAAARLLHDNPTHATFGLLPLMSARTYAELKREGREDVNPCPMAKLIAERRHG